MRVEAYFSRSGMTDWSCENTCLVCCIALWSEGLVVDSAFKAAVAAGVPILENRPDCIYFGAAGHVLGTGHTLRDEFTAYVPSRPQLEWQIRQRVLKIANVEIQHRSVAHPKFDADTQRVTGVYLDSDGGEDSEPDYVPADLVRACRPVVRKPLWIKLTPNTSDIVALAKACADGGADGLSIINTITGMAIDVRTRRPKIATTFGGLSGPAIKPIALRLVYQAVQAVKIPVTAFSSLRGGPAVSCNDLLRDGPDLGEDRPTPCDARLEVLA